MTNLIDFITVTNNIKGVSFASFKNYANSNGEVANHKVNLGATLDNAKAKDLVNMQNTNANDMFEDFTFENSKIDFATFQKAFNELYDSLVKIGDKNLDGTVKVKSARSYAQTDAYTVINSSVKVHNELNRLYIYGLRVSKEILEAGVYPTVNKQAKTVCKDFIKNQLEMKHTKFVMYIVEGIDVMNMSKTSFDGVDLSISL